MNTANMNMNVNNMEICEINKINKNFIVKMIYVIAYIAIYAINYKKINAYFNKKEEEEEEERDVNTWYTIFEGQSRYKGEWKNGLPNGKGVKEYFEREGSCHCIIECTFVNGQAEGYGKQIYDKTDDDEMFAPYYEGQFKNSKQNGYGAYYWGDGSYHIGEYCDGLFHGKSVYYNKQKNIVWIGEYVNDKKSKGEWYVKHQIKVE